ncbi:MULTISPECIES: replication initiation negative regulator SeqA [Vibrio]|uniref:replication initiation negative regulator SeqA n=1 Tax=Vibrio TaxID=662 RepID=UPI000C169D78|nr:MULTISPECIES: replication initiation negative regulator SeqA [Vibrio]NAW70205.1 replication initiation negative regulator SeqA [Vibrio sp. V28_P6S34P95]NAX06443.1 replication initiation negative regulator SeqA [Vibrio sp. V30_P3S12P165]NAX34342.1 replication initiation negative regulator SeqA [Vibrio sp. V29_P1S30P107]NAX37849.1 replication initiation negative regulator SeqA [Vibrio sp. V27_P1S3P104]NAX41674.1 replication initiation negative regulator SeqA [Vibrio sp. V26_P1S5P106]
MKTIEVDEDLYRYIASQTQHIGESASDILRRLLNVARQPVQQSVQQPVSDVLAPKGIVVSKDAAQETKIDSVKEMRGLLISDEFADLKKAIDRFMLVLSTLYRIDPESFSEAMSVKGRKRVYFADNEQTLLANGQTTKPKAIPNTPFWVITNNNTSRKQQMVEQVMVRMNFPTEIIDKVTQSI